VRSLDRSEVPWAAMSLGWATSLTSTIVRVDSPCRHEFELAWRLPADAALAADDESDAVGDAADDACDAEPVSLDAGPPGVNVSAGQGPALTSSSPSKSSSCSCVMVRGSIDPLT
jgi:hypothetical protein